jgi:hypothetical protein
MPGLPPPLPPLLLLLLLLLLRLRLLRLRLLRLLLQVHPAPHDHRLPSVWPGGAGSTSGARLHVHV